MPDGRLLTDAELTNFAFLVLLGGMDTTSGTTGNSLLLIDRDPALRQRMVDNVDSMPKVIEEFLRIGTLALSTGLEEAVVSRPLAGLRPFVDPRRRDRQCCTGSNHLPRS